MPDVRPRSSVPRVHDARRPIAVGLVALTLAAGLARGVPPTIVASPPADDRTVVLFDGTAWTGWRRRDGTPSAWIVQPDGSARVDGGDAISDVEFRDVQLHLEFLCPAMPDARGQARANSGVYLHGRYEVQILDSHGLAPSIDGCGAIYSIAPPLVDASRPPGTWQTFDIVFRAPRLDDAGRVTEPPRLTVFHNGLVVQSHVPVPHPTRAGLADDMPAEGPLMLQDHGNPVLYRNIWIRRLDDAS